MKGLFNWNSRLMQGLAMVTNLVALNLLWIICCIPIFTAGAATTALYQTVIQYQTQQDDAVFRHFSGLPAPTLSRPRCCGLRRFCRSAL